MKDIAHSKTLYYFVVLNGPSNAYLSNYEVTYNDISAYYRKKKQQQYAIEKMHLYSVVLQIYIFIIKQKLFRD